MSFRFGRKHVKGEICRACCCTGPESCEEEGCTGFVHQDVVDEVRDDDDYYWIHNYKCDTCKFTSYATPELPVEFEDVN